MSVGLAGQREEHVGEKQQVPMVTSTLGLALPRPTPTLVQPYGTIAVEMNHKQPLLGAQGKPFLI